MSHSPCLAIDSPKRSDAGTVIVIEDDAATRDSLVALLEAEGIGVWAFSSCDAFLPHAGTVENSCLLLDYHFSGEGMNGFELLDRLAAEGVAIPTIVLSGWFDATLRRRAMQRAEVRAVLEKPVGGHPVIAAVRLALAAAGRPNGKR